MKRDMNVTPRHPMPVDPKIPVLESIRIDDNSYKIGNITFYRLKPVGQSTLTENRNSGVYIIDKNGSTMIG